MPASISRSLKPTLIALAFIAIIGIGILIVKITLLASPDTPDQATSENGIADENYSFDTPTPGQTFHTKIEQYKRYGPHRDAIESDLTLQLPTETSTREMWYRIGPNSEILDIRMDVNSADGRPLYSHTSPAGDRYQVTDHRTNTQEDGGPVPQFPSPSDPVEQRDFADVYTDLGWEQSREASFNGRVTLVFETVAPISPQRPPAGDSISTPVYYDLQGVEFRIEAHVDAESGVVLQNFRYVVDAAGNDTVIEYFKILISRQEG
jgi:hypothetical protein